MRNSKTLSLPTTLLTLIATTSVLAADQAWTPSIASLELRTLHGDQAQETPTHSRPAKVRKMSEDEGEKLFLQHWSFGEQAPIAPHEAQDSALQNNSILLSPLHAPYAHHSHLDRRSASLRFLERNIFGRQSDWGSCPGNTYACTDIGEPNACCNTGETCFVAGDGQVGCCPDEETCGTTVLGCATEQGYSSCPGSENGGCCIPGYTCEGVGCVIAATSTVYTTLPVETVTTGTLPNPTPSTSTDDFPDTIIVPVVDTTTSSYTSTTTVVAVAPVRPTSASDASDEASPSPTSTTVVVVPETPSVCPGGYYMCSAVYRGDCCRVGRDCDTTSCPATPTNTIVASSPTIVVPGTSTVVVGAGAGAGATTGTSAAAAATRGGCANNWYLCPQDQGGDCCPLGYECGEQECLAQDSGVADVGKEAPSAAVLGAERWVAGVWVLGFGVAVGMVVL